jgi:hypothetical protein
MLHEILIALYIQVLLNLLHISVRDKIQIVVIYLNLFIFFCEYVLIAMKNKKRTFFWVVTPYSLGKSPTFWRNTSWTKSKPWRKRARIRLPGDL